MPSWSINLDKSASATQSHLISSTRLTHLIRQLSNSRLVHLRDLLSRLLGLLGRFFCDTVNSRLSPGRVERPAVLFRSARHTIRRRLGLLLVFNLLLLFPSLVLALSLLCSCSAGLGRRARVRKIVHDTSTGHDHGNTGNGINKRLVLRHPFRNAIPH